MGCPDSGSPYSHQTAIRILLYWIGFWLLAFDGVWLVFNLLLQGFDNLRSLPGLVISHILYATLGAIICLSLFIRQLSQGRWLVTVTGFWAAYWTLIAIGYLRSRSECAYSPVDSCGQWRMLGLIVGTPLAFIYSAIAGLVGCSFFLILFPSNKSPR